jgi:hypothetical protein
MHRIAAAPLLVLMLIAGQQARSAETAGIITLSCEGTVRSGPGSGDVERVSERGVVVNLAEHTVIGFVTNTGSALIANIVHVDDISVDFTGASTSSSVIGTIDRVTGATTAHTTTWAKDKVLGREITRGLSYYLVCKATNRLRWGCHYPITWTYPKLEEAPWHLGTLAPERRLPPPRSVEANNACFVVKDHDGKSPGMNNFRAEPGASQVASASTYGASGETGGTGGRKYRIRCPS